MNLPTPRRLTVALIIVSILVLAFVISGCSQLSNKQSTVNKKFVLLVPELNVRYSKLSDAITIAEDAGGKRDVTVDGKKALKKFEQARKEKNTSGQLESARELETIIGRMRANATSSPKLADSKELKAKLDEIDKYVPAAQILKPYEDAVSNYEEARTSWRLLLSSIIGGFSAPEKLEFSKPSK